MKIKKLLSFFTIALSMIVTINSCVTPKKLPVDTTSGATIKTTSHGNSLYHNTDLVNLKTGSLLVEGEVGETGNVDFGKFYKREVFVKESYLQGNDQEFKGAYRYSGYSLFDILNEYKLAKKNADVFRPEIDVYIKIENDRGETAVFSWSEIFHTLNPHAVIIATDAAPIKPHRKEVTYPTANSWKVVASNDLYSHRNIENPTKITVVSFNKKHYNINRELETVYSDNVKVISDKSVLGSSNAEFNIDKSTDSGSLSIYNSTFYGMGMGYHPNPVFKGILLHEAFNERVNFNDTSLLKEGIVCFSSIDGYRAIFSFSELFNRADQVIPMLAVTESADGGYYRIYLPTDFYADRSVKGLSEIFLFKD